MTLAQSVWLTGCAEPSVRTDAELRTIDELLSLMKARLEFAAKAAQASWLSGGPRDDPVRSDELVDAAVNRAFEYSLPPELVREFFSAQAGAASHVQSVLLAQWQAQPASRPQTSAGLPQTQPRIEPSSVPLLSALSTAYPILRRPGGRDLLLQRAEKLLAEIPGGIKTSALALGPLLSVAH